jgi:hypothetical protein
VKFLVDECLSPTYVARLAAVGHPDSWHPRDGGLRSRDDHILVRVALEQDRIILTSNLKDFKALLRHAEIHPGLIAVPPLLKDETWALVLAALAYLALQPRPADFMVNRILEVSVDGRVESYMMPPE